MTVFEAAPQPGGQVRLTAQTKRRAEMIGIIDWRMAQCAALGVEFRFNTWAEADEILAENPDVVIIATGGLPEKDILKFGNDLTVSAWDILSGDVKPGSNVLLYDDAGDHTALQAAQTLTEAGAKVEIMTPDRSFAPEVMAMNLVPYMRALQDKNTTFTVTYRLTGVEKDGNQIKATVDSDYMTLGKTTPLRSDRRQPRHPAAGRHLLRSEAAIGQPWRGRLRRTDRRSAANLRRRSGRLPAVPHR